MSRYTPTLVAVRTPLVMSLAGYPLDRPPWEGVTEPIRLGHVRQAIRDDQLWPAPLYSEVANHPRSVHIARIAWLAVHWRNDGTDPPQVEAVGPYQLVVNDGYHRICAAIVRTDLTVVLDVGGWLDAAEEMFGVAIP